jgi:hypothetical protein
MGSNFKVNDDTGYTFQRFPSIAADGKGNFIITWRDYRNGDPDIYAQRYSNDGIPFGSNFKVNDDTGSTKHYAPSVATDGSGNFIVTWYECCENVDVYAQRYSSDGTAVGSNFKVTEDAASPSIAANDSGNFVITWLSSDIYAQRYSSDGTTVGSNFKVSDDTGSAKQSASSIATDGNGNFIIAWVDQRNGYYDIFAQRFSNDEIPLMSNFKVNDDSVSVSQYYPSIAAGSSGNFIITWIDLRASLWGVYAQQYSSDGTAVGSSFKVNESSFQLLGSSIAADDAGNFIIAWSYCCEDQNVYARRYSSDGTAVGSNFKVNDDTGDVRHNYPSVAADSSGNFMITWRDGRDGDFAIFAQRYSNDGTAVGSNFKVNESTEFSFQLYPSIAADGSGNFIITWIDSSIYAQRYSNDGIALGSNFKVNENTDRAVQDDPSIAADGSGNFVITWQDERNGDPDIYAQRYSGDGTAVGGNFRVTNTSEKIQRTPDVKLWNNRIYNTWTDNRVGGTGYDIWANVLEWDNPVGIEADQIPSSFLLHQNYPNPFNPETTITYQLPKAAAVKLEIYNITGQKIATLVVKKQPAGDYSLQWLGMDDSGRQVTSGVYVYRLHAGDFVESRKMLLLR